MQKNKINRMIYIFFIAASMLLQFGCTRGGRDGNYLVKIKKSNKRKNKVKINGDEIITKENLREELEKRVTKLEKRHGFIIIPPIIYDLPDRDDDIIIKQVNVKVDPSSPTYANNQAGGINVPI